MPLRPVSTLATLPSPAGPWLQGEGDAGPELDPAKIDDFLTRMDQDEARAVAEAKAKKRESKAARAAAKAAKEAEAVRGAWQSEAVSRPDAHV